MSEVEYAKPLPFPDRDSGPYWHALANDELRVQRCSSCGEHRWPARPICPDCWSGDASWELMSGRGRLSSWTEVHHSPMLGFRAEIPYNLALVQLDESPKLILLANVVPSEVRLTEGMRLRAVFDHVTPEVTLLRWAPLHVRWDGDAASAGDG